MGSFADAMSRFAQPIIDDTDGSPEQLQQALKLSQLCWNLATLPETKRNEMLASMQPALKMSDAEFEKFQHDVVSPMIRRHQEMFPAMQGSGSTNPSDPVPRQTIFGSPPQRPVKKYAGTGRNERCPCGSGKKFKFCCGR